MQSPARPYFKSIICNAVPEETKREPVAPLLVYVKNGDADDLL